MNRKITTEYLRSIGVSVTLSRYIANNYDNFLEVLQYRPLQLSSFLDTAYIEKLRINDAKKRYAAKLFEFLSEYDFPENHIMHIYDEYGENALNVIKDNPYKVRHLTSFNILDNFALLKGESCYSVRRYMAAIMEVLDNCISVKDDELETLNGSMFVYKDQLAAYTSMLLGFCNDDFNYSVYESALTKLFFNKEIYILKLNGKADAVYHKKLASIEFGIAENIKRRLKEPSKKYKNLISYIEKSEAELGILLSEEQSNAVKTALSSPISVITGGPGTGKTSVQKVLIESYRWATKCGGVKLIAPTGQAAKRMSESTGYPATTIHKALNLMPGQKKNEKSIVIKEGLLIADEASMIDAELFYQLLESVSVDTKIVIVGDIEQLPSIGVGSVLEQLIKCPNIPTARLTKVFRQASDSPIAYNAARVKVGQNLLIENDDFEFICNSDYKTLPTTVCDVYKEAVEKVGIDNVICLSAYRRHTETGVNNLNKVLRNTIRPEIETENIPYIKINNLIFYKGDKVVFGKNANGLVNGDLGIIEEICGKRNIKCKFGNKSIYLKNHDLDFLDLAFAQTVHKSQGAEFNTVILVVDKRHANLLMRALIYTGLTRAKQHFVCICDSRDTFNNAIATINSPRNSLLEYLV